MELKKFNEVKHLLPAESWAAWRNEKNNGEFEDEVVMYHQGDLEMANLNLDMPDENEQYVFFILVEGNLKAGNIFNKDTDGATGLIVLGDLSAENIVVGGQEIYVTGALRVTDLYWGDYNHGTLVVNGPIQARVFISTDYSFDYKRFESKDRVDVPQLLWDEESNEYEDGDRIALLLEERFLQEPEDEIYSWSDWLDRSAILEALANNTPVLMNAFVETPPSFFQDDLINEANLLRFADSPILTGEHEDLMIQYGDTGIYRRVYMKRDKPLTMIVYFQQGQDFACIVYFSTEGKVAKAYKELTGDIWRSVDENAPRMYQEFLEDNWRKLLPQFSEMTYVHQQFQVEITPGKIQEILDLPLVRQKHHDYYNEDHVIEYGAFQYSFRLPGDGEGRTPRVTIIRVLRDDKYDFFHYDLVDGAVLLHTQNADGYDSQVVRVGPAELEKNRNALQYFRKFEKVIREMNDEFIEGDED
jgi:hypothetical protein